MSYCVILSTAENSEQAEKLTNILLENRVAACIQQMPISSSYFWDGKIEKSNEILLLIKTQSDKYKDVQELIAKNHSYDIPEIIKIPIEDGLGSYLNWIKSSVKKD